MNCSFTPAGDWFVFDEDTGHTLKRWLRTKAEAITWMANKANKK